MTMHGGFAGHFVRLLSVVVLGETLPLANRDNARGMHGHVERKSNESNMQFMRTLDFGGALKYSPESPLRNVAFEMSPWRAMKKEHLSENTDNSVRIAGAMAGGEDEENKFGSSVDEGANVTVGREDSSASETEPFAVDVDEVQFYGGLVTYSHAQHPARICRVMNACLRQDDTLVLPEWMERHDNILRFQCGHNKLEFSLPDTSPPPVLDQFDLIGLKVPRPSMPDFLQDFIPNAVVFDLVYGDHEVLKSCHSRKGAECEIFPELSQGFRPAVFLHSRLRGIPEKRSWARQFVRLMKPPDVGKQAKILYERVHDSEPNLRCYKSAFFTRGPYNKNVIMSDHLRRMHFLELNGINRRRRRAPGAYAGGIQEQKGCRVNITISNRKVVEGAHNRLIGRFVKNLPELREAIIRQAKRVPGLNVTVESMTLEGRSLWWHINGMQKTDVWVAGHGPLLSNMLFLREGSTIVELQPFTYYPRTYENMARYLAHVNYDRYIAHPDVEAFKRCMNHLYSKKHPSFRTAADLLIKFSKAAEKYLQYDSTHSLTLHNFNDTSLHFVKKCAQMQRLNTDAKNLAITVIRHARLKCDLPKPAPVR